MDTTKNLVLVGIISSVHGTNGNVIVKSFTEPILNITKMKLIDEKGKAVILKIVRQNAAGGFICKLNEINNRTVAEALKGQKLYCLRSDLPLLSEEEYYIEDLKGIEVVDESMRFLGKVKAFLNFGAGDIIEIEFKDNTSQLFPFTKEFFPVIKASYLVFKKRT